MADYLFESLEGATLTLGHIGLTTKKAPYGCYGYHIYPDKKLQGYFRRFWPFSKNLPVATLDGTGELNLQNGDNRYRKRIHERIQSYLGLGLNNETNENNNIWKMRDKQFDEEYIALSDIKGTRMYHVPKIIDKIKFMILNLVNDYSGPEDLLYLDEIGLDDYLMDELGLEENDIANISYECEDTFPEYRPYEDDFTQWRTVHDVVCSVVRAMEDYLTKVDNGVRKLL